jgi:hypothetical protein
MSKAVPVSMALLIYSRSMSASCAFFIGFLEKKSQKHLLDKNVLVISQHQNSKNTLLL